MDDLQYSELFKLIPFVTLDGINEKGLFCNINVVPGGYNKTGGKTSTVLGMPNKGVKHEFCDRMMPRFILDNFESAEAACKYIQDYVKVYTSKPLAEMNYELHYMIGDKNNTFVLEFINNKATYKK